MKIRNILFSVMTACVAVILFPGFSAKAESTVDIIDGVIADGVYIGEIDVSGMTEAEAKAAVDQYMKEAGQESLVVRAGKESVRTKLNDLGLQWSNRDVVKEASALGKTGNLIKRYKDLVSLQYENHIFGIETVLDDKKLNDFIQEEMEEFNQEVKEPSLTREGGTFQVTPSAEGLEVNESETAEAIKEAVLNAEGYSGLSVEAVCEVTKPKHDSSELEAVQDVLATYSTKYNSSNVGRTQSLELSAQRLNGIVMYPGDTISTSLLMGERSVEGGYSTAIGYVGTQSVDMIGAGICQTASTLYCAALYAELDIVERSNHTKTVSYVPYSMDATIYAGDDYRNPNIDLKLKNGFRHPVYIESSVGGGTCTFTIYGKKTDSSRQVDYVSTTLQEAYPEPQFVEDPNLPYGYTVQTQDAYPQVVATLTKIVRVNGVETERSVLHTDKYKPSNAVFNVGINPALPPIEGQTPIDMSVLPQQPADGTQQPADGTQQPADGTQQPADGSQQPADGSQQPADGTQQPADGSQQPADGTQQPADGSQQPADGSQQPPEGEYGQPVGEGQTP